MFSRISTFAGVLALTITIALPAAAAPTPSQACNSARIKAATKYAGCQAKARTKLEVSSDIGALKIASSKCRTKYAAEWPKLQAKFAMTSTACDQNRFTDSVDTVVDNLTGLEWEKKTDTSTVHDKDNSYNFSWTGDGDPTNADGTAFDVFLWDLNGFLFSGVGDWRLPTREEMQTLLIEPFPCSTSPCISATFGLTEPSFHLTSSRTFLDPTSVWAVSFGAEELTLMSTTANLAVRGVRGGL